MKLLSWGANSYGQLGHGVKSEQCVVPLEVQDGDLFISSPNVVDVTGGGGHTLALDENGHVFGCGWNKKGQLGLSDKSEVLTLNQLEFLQNYKIKKIICGWESSLALTWCRKLLAWGSNTYCEIGLDKSKVKYSPTPVSVPVPVVRTLSCGLRHTAIVSEAGHVFVCGSGRKGQLGIMTGDGSTSSETVEPVAVPGISDVQSVACGQHHTLALTHSGRLFVWGDNKYGQLGLSPDFHPAALSPTEIQPFPKETLPPGCRIFCGWTHTVLITDKGDVYNWGRNTYGQLGCYEFERPEPWKPSKMESVSGVTQMAVGSEHNLALLDDGRLMSWGWNEHGSCGTGTEVNVCHPTPVAVNSGNKTVLIGTGAGHSFAVIRD